VQILKIFIIAAVFRFESSRPACAGEKEIGFAGCGVPQMLVAHIRQRNSRAARNLQFSSRNLHYLRILVSAAVALGVQQAFEFATALLSQSRKFFLKRFEAFAPRVMRKL
jgi:hypothetical protein